MINRVTFLLFAALFFLIHSCNGHLPAIALQTADSTGAAQGVAKTAPKPFIAATVAIKSAQVYQADIQYGFIGTSAAKPVDNPFDNIFHVNIGKLPAAGTCAWLEYELFGAADHTCIARSINEAQSAGGYFVRLSNAWTLQKEAISPFVLHEGDNVVRFALPANAAYHYEVRNVHIVFEKRCLPKAVILLNQPHECFYNNRAYIKGIIQPAQGSTASMLASGKLYYGNQRIPIYDGEFEAIIANPRNQPFRGILRLVLSDGESVTQRVSFVHNLPLSQLYIPQTKGTTNAAQFKKATGARVGLLCNNASVSIQIPPRALPADKTISITALRDVDLPALNAGMLNVTAGSPGFRFLPHGSKFSCDAQLSIPFDNSLIPEGYTAADIRTYYFDEQSRRWLALPIDSVSATTGSIVSNTTHFTDMINGIVKVTESTQTSGYVPTAIKDFQSASPSAGINFISPPSANNMGEASLSFALKLPDGRAGMQPELALEYSNGSGNGWLGLGWSLPVAAVSIESRWGVPRFDASDETETYLLDGEQLAPNARDTLMKRVAEKRFHPRIEKNFERIIRHGNAPSDYWWEVTDKKGVRNFYGGTPAAGVTDSSVLRDDRGHIAYWGLVETTDLNGNTVHYRYTTVNDAGVADINAIKGRQLYMASIFYTGKDTADGPYKIDFIRDRQLNEPRRKDVAIDYRTGVKMVTADLLRKITIQFKNQPVRSYELKYTTGAFFKTLLTSITELDTTGAVFYTHNFDYYDDVKDNGQQPLMPVKLWQTPRDNISGGLINPIPHFKGETSLLSTEKSSSIGGGGAVTIGFIGDGWSKGGTVGGSFNYDQSNNDGLVSLVDINGDNLPDKVFKSGNSLFYHPNLGTSAGFGDAQALKNTNGENITSFSSSQSQTFGGGVQVVPSAGTFFGYDYTSTTSTTSTYLADFNGDGLTDININGQVYFNTINAQGLPVFDNKSTYTPNPLILRGTVDKRLLSPDTALQSRQEKQFPLQDVVRFWEAPFYGTVTITAPVQLVAVADSLKTKKDDGVRVSIQLNNQALWSANINSGDYALKIPANVSNIQVNKGDRLFFRLQSVYDGQNDIINWNPAINYVVFDTSLYPLYNASKNNSTYYSAAEDFLLTGRQPVGITKTGTIKLHAGFTKLVTSDTVSVVISRFDSLAQTITSVVLKQYADSDLVNITIDTAFAVTRGDVLNFDINADSYIDRTRVNGLLHYTLEYVDNSNTKDSLSGAIIPQNDAYNDWLIAAPAFTVPQKDTVTIVPALVLDAADSGDVVFTVKSYNNLVAKQVMHVNNGSLISPPDSIHITCQPGVPLFFEYHIANRSFALNAMQNMNAIGAKDTMVYKKDTIINSRDTVIGGKKVIVKDTTFKDTLVKKTLLRSLQTGLYTNSDTNALRPVFRGWGQFSFKGDITNAPLDVAKLNFNEFKDTSAFQNALNDTAKYRRSSGTAPITVSNPAQTNFVPVYANALKQGWYGRDSSVFVTGSLMSSARLWLHDVSVDSLMTGAAISAVSKIETSAYNSFAAGAGIIGNYSFGSSTNQLDMMDMNGDEFPDILHVDDVQYTMPDGGLSATAIVHGLGGDANNGSAFGFNLGGNFLQASAKSDVGTMARSEENNASVAVGFSGNASSNNANVASRWVDINGDGLPDKLYDNGTVALNTGYAFESVAENWGFDNIEKSNTISAGLGLGFNIAGGSFSGGIGTSLSSTVISSTLIDVNGDGLPDQLQAATDGLIARLNTGNGFDTTKINWQRGGAIVTDSSAGESINAAFTIAIDIPIPFFPIKICINPSSETGHGVSSQQDQIMDIDGDGFPDLLHSENEGNLTVARSSIGRTNLLRHVQQPMGSSFTMDYERKGNTYNMPNSIWVLHSLEVYDGVKGDGADTARSSFTYNGAYYNRREREFFGFDSVVTNELNTLNSNAIYRSKVALYLNGNFYNKGLIKAEWLQDSAGRKFTASTNTYELQKVEDSVYFPALVETDELFYEGSSTPGATTLKRYKYDTLGNVIFITDLGDGSQNDFVNASITYHNNDNQYIKEVPATVEVTNYEGVKRKRTTVIDDKGQITRINEFLADGKTAQFDIEYDRYGNMSKITRPENYKGERLWFSYLFDDAVHTYVIKTTDAYGYTDSSAYEYLFGNQVFNLDRNNEPMRYSIDSRGRTSSVTGPYEIAAGKPYTLSFEYYPSANVPYAITHHYDPEYDDDIDIFTFSDGLGRILQTKKQGSIFRGKTQADGLEMIVSGKIIYDAFGRTAKQYYPTTEAIGPANTNLSLVSGNIESTTDYDVDDRPLVARLADGTTDNMHYTADTNMLGVLHTDALGNKVEKISDVRGRLRSIQQLSGPAGVVTTSYYYDALDELLRVEDNNKNNIVNTYDNFGRKISEQHPDAGLIQFNYDLAGNLIQKITPQIRRQVSKGGAIQYQYDHERLTGIDYPVQYQNKVTYTYGKPGTGAKAGRIILQEDASGGLETFYGKLGEVTKTIRTVLVNSDFYTTYVSEQEYDTWNRIKKMVYADGEEVLYHYNRAGGLNSISGQKLGNTYSYVNRLGYDEFEDKVYMQYGNGTETNYAYDSLRRRLVSLQALTSSGRYMIDNRYTYDPVNNITSITNSAKAQAGKLGGYASQKYTYDNLYRLTNATGLYQGYKDTAAYTLGMGYDNLFNIINKKLSNKAPPKSYDNAYTYGGKAPHQPTQIGGKTCTYDANGNLYTYGNTEYYWDEDNRLNALIDSGTVNEFTYDADGERVIKSSGGLQGAWLNGAPAGTVNHFDNYTVYVSPYLVCRQNSFTKHIYIESDRVATQIGSGAFTNISFPQPALTAGGVNYTQRAKQLQQQRTNYYASLGVSPGPPTDKLFYAEPQNNGITAPVLVDSTAHNIPPGWPGDTTKPVNGGPPVFTGTIPSSDSVKAGYGFKGTGHYYEVDQYFYHTDQLGSTSYISDITGEAEQHVEYVAFGETLFEEHNRSFTTTYLFSGKELDDETGLYYYGARYYNPVISQWISVDPIAVYGGNEQYEPDNLAVYTYCSQSPVVYTDPEGKIKKKFPQKLKSFIRRIPSLNKRKRETLKATSNAKSILLKDEPVSSNYRQTFSNEYNVDLNNEKLVVHHAIEKQVLTRYKGLFSWYEINGARNLRGIPKDLNTDMHLSAIRREWDNFYQDLNTEIAGVTSKLFFRKQYYRKKFIKKALEIDKLYGKYFNPPIK